LPEVIRLAVLLYVKYPLILRNVEDLLAERGIDISHETVRYWVEQVRSDVRSRHSPAACQQHARLSAVALALAIVDTLPDQFLVLDDKLQVLAAPAAVFARSSKMTRRCPMDCLSSISREAGGTLLACASVSKPLFLKTQRWKSLNSSRSLRTSEGARFTSVRARSDITLTGLKILQPPTK